MRIYTNKENDKQTITGRYFEPMLSLCKDQGKEMVLSAYFEFKYSIDQIFHNDLIKVINFDYNTFNCT